MIALFFVLLSTIVQAIPGIAGTGTIPPLPSGVHERFGSLVAPVEIDGARVIDVAAGVSDPAAVKTLLVRRARVASAIGTLLSTVSQGGAERPLYDPRTLRVVVAAAGNADVLLARDAAHAPVRIVSVTAADAAAAQTTVIALAELWRTRLQSALVRALRDREPAVQATHLREAAIAGAAAILIAALLLWAVRLLRRRADALSESADAREPPAYEERAAFLAVAIRRLPQLRGAAFMRAAAALFTWIAVVELFAVLVWSLSLFPQTSPIAGGVSHTATVVAGIWIAAGLLNRIGDLLLRRFEHLYAGRRFASPEERARELLRLPTVTTAIGGFKAFLLIFVAILATLGQIGLPVASVVTVGGLAAIGISLAAQNLIRDLVNGFLVLFEDQYVVGDFVVINGMSGLVETLTLRMVQLRDAGGSLITIPHSTATTVVNRSRNWSRVDYRVSIDPKADAERAIALVREALESLAARAEWHDAIVDPVEYIGIDAMSRDGVVIRASVKTAPLRQFEVQRAVNEAVRERFAKAEIPFGAPIA